MLQDAGQRLADVHHPRLQNEFASYYATLYKCQHFYFEYKDAIYDDISSKRFFVSK